MSDKSGCVKNAAIGFIAVMSKVPTLLVLIAGVLWSFSGILIKEIHWNAIGIAGVRSLIGGLLQFGFLLFYSRRQSKISATTISRVFSFEGSHWLGALFFVLNMSALVWAFQLTSAADAVFLHYSGLVLVALVSWPVLGQRLSSRDWLAVLIALIGIGMLAFDGLQAHNPVGVMLGISCGITLAGAQVCLGLRSVKQKTGTEALETLILGNLIMVLAACVYALFVPLSMPDPTSCLLLLILGIVPWGLPDILYVVAIKHVPLFRALILGLADPVLTAVWPALFLGEMPTVLAFCGAATVLGAIAYQAKCQVKAPALLP
ncbi:MAG: DMT family transporter [Candidatus Obscuribacterales bacterium]|nr:DMT family transporter [Candidatus Obscuribacterales bacterium]